MKSNAASAVYDLGYIVEAVLAERTGMTGRL